MARFEFGGTMAAWVVTEDSDGDLVIPSTATTLEIYDAPGGALVTDFLDEVGNPISAIVVPAGTAYIPRFSGPEGAASLWVQSADGRWLPVPRYDDGSGSDGSAGAVLLSGANTYAYAASNDGSGPWLRVDVPDDGSDSNSWPNRLEFRFEDLTTGQMRHGFHVNEKSLLRTRGTTPTDVPVRFMAHPAQSSGTALVEFTLSDNTVKLFQQFLGVAKFLVGVQVPYVENPYGERLYFGTADPATDPAYADHRPNVGDAWLDYNGEGV